MSLTPAHLDALTALGYTPQEAHFLYLVATHSGYFRARQFLGFTRAHWGKRTTQFWSKLQARKHARTECFPTYGLVYHVFARRLYGHLGRENLRNRREHEIQYVQRRIDTFDFVLAHLDYDYLETEAEKVAYFEQTCAVPGHLLPSRTYYGQQDAQPTVRYFVDRFPLFVLRSSSPPVAAFSYIQPPEANLMEFTRHLNQYLPLFRTLPAFRFVYLARNHSHFAKAQELFDSLVTIPLRSSPASDLLRYFTIRKAWDLRQYAAVSEPMPAVPLELQSFHGRPYNALSEFVEIQVLARARVENDSVSGIAHGKPVLIQNFRQLPNHGHRLRAGSCLRSVDETLPDRPADVE